MITKAGVPGNKIVVGVTSYGRSFAMEQPGCWGPTCKFTGTRLESHATPGRCTGTAGYIADAEINEIINGGSGSKRQSRVVTHFLDPSSNSDILVYDNDQWVGYMSEKTKGVRAALYAGLGMAGTTDWASDLQEFREVPPPSKDWPAFISKAVSGQNPKEDTTTTIGNWKSFTCEHPVIASPYIEGHPPSMRWKAVDTDSAWREVVAKWFNTDSKNFMTFSQSVEQTLKAGAALSCESFLADNCHGPIYCPAGANGALSGPAAGFILISLTRIHEMHHGYYTNLGDMTGQYALAADDMENTFAPIPEPKTNQWLNIFIDLLTIGTLGVAGPFFNSFLKQLPSFIKNGELYDNVKDTTMNIIGQSTTLTKDMLESPGPDRWTPGEQDKFSNYIGQVIMGWRKSAELVNRELFNGTQKSVQALGKIMANGALIPGYVGSDPPSNTTATDLKLAVLKTFYGFSIPLLWRRSKTYAFVLDSGAGCDGNPSSKYVSDTTASTTRVCYKDRLYYLVHPEGDDRDDGEDNTFKAPVGLDELGRFGGLTVENLVIGAVNTWKANDMQNGGKVLDPINNAQARSDLVGGDITTPGFVLLPVCSGDRAFQSWQTAKRDGSPNWPCDIPPGVDKCDDSTYEDRTHDESPTVEDCRQIVKNIEGDGSTEFTHRITGHREILSFGSCHFGIERTGGTGGAVEFVVGGQNVIDVINQVTISYGGRGRMAARGVMPCQGTTAGTKVNVEWGIY
jgi:hypothetical protein